MTFKDLSFKKKLEHIWEYYKWVILGTLFIIFAGSSIVYATLIREKPVNYAGVAVYRSHITQEQSESLTSALNSALGLAAPDTVTLSNYYFEENDPIFNVEMEQKFVTYLFSKELQVVLGVQSDIEMLIDAEYIAPLNEYYTDEELAQLDEKGLVMYRTDPLDEKEKPFAVDIDGSSLCKSNKIFEGYNEKTYAVIVPIEGFKDNSRAVIGELLK